MTLAELHLQRGMEKGIATGVEQGLKKGLKKGLEKGLKTGLKQGKAEVATRLLAKGYSLADVVEITGLSMQEIVALQTSATETV